MLMKEGEEATIGAVPPGWLPPNTTHLVGSDFHYNLFESLISGRSVFGSKDPPSDRFRGIFQAQLLKDTAMANKVNQLLKDSADDKEKFLVVAGNGHLLHWCGVPERVLNSNPGLSNQTCVIVSHPSTADLEDEGAVKRDLEDSFGPEGWNPGDFVFVFKDDRLDYISEEIAKAETKHAYDKVGESAHLEGSMTKAKAIMCALGYTDELFEIAGRDAYNFQGVGNPHLHANIRPGDRVLDVGSGLGVDSFIARHFAGEDGKVVGIDISSKEVKHAQERADARGLDIRFAVGDMEDIPFPDNTFDVIISNGAMCLAPNKEKAFSEILRVLKPGGRISICTSTIKEDHLQAGVNWPLCMKMFIPLKEVAPLCEKLGYVDVVVDDSDSSMTVELPEEVLENGVNPERNRVHVGSDEFKHLENYDMDEICARVCVFARKPE
jgi:SAM-dependent methyltransferase